MNEITLSSGHKIPSIGFGLYQLSKDVTPTITSKAIDVGYRHFDCARVYKNERELGETLSNVTNRDDLFITTKLDKEGTSSQALRHVKKSIRWLQCHYLDLMLIHSATPGYDRRIEAWYSLNEAYDQGLCKSIGVSNYGIKHLEEIRKLKDVSVNVPHVNQIQIHPWCQNKSIVEYCRQHNIVIEAYSPLARSQKWSDQTIQSVSKKHNVTPAQVLIKWSLQHGFIPLVKTENLNRLSENLLLDVKDFKLDDDDIKAIDDLDEGNVGAVTWNPVDCE